MDIPLPTEEQRVRFQAEFAEYWNSLEQSPHDHLPDRTDAESIWVVCSAYREMQINNLLSTVHEPAEIEL